MSRYIAILNQEQLIKHLKNTHKSRYRIEQELGFHQDRIRALIRFEGRYHVVRDQETVTKLKQYFNAEDFVAFEGDL